MCPKIWAKPPAQNEKSLLPLDVRRSKTSLLESLLSGLFRTLTTPAISGNVVLSHANSDWYAISR